MKKILFLICLSGGGFAFASGQVANQTQPAQVIIGTSRGGGISDTERRSSPRDTRRAARRESSPAYRKPTREDLLLVAPAAVDSAKYANFLRQPRTGLIRLLSDAGCQKNANILVANDFCLKYKNVFGGSAYSFRTGNYALGRFSDVVYKNGTLYLIGKMTLGFLTDLGGNVPLSNVSATTAGAKYVFDFAPPEDFPKLAAAATDFQKGVDSNGFKYQKFYALRENHTYLLRSIAYRRRGASIGGVRVYDELNDDERKDVIVAFQIVRLPDADKSSVTILWKELQRKNGLKVKVEKK